MAQATIVGTTTWGTTLGIHLGRNNVSSVLLARTAQEAQDIATARENHRFLPGVPFPEKLTVTHDPAEALKGSKVVIMAVPSQRFRQNLLWIKDSIEDGSIVLSATKGLEMDSGKRMSQVLSDELPGDIARRYCVLSGPNMAMEIIAQKPASTVIASEDKEASKLAQSILMSPSFRVYTNDDVIGVELGGALKNIIALGSGISDGLGYGDNAKAAFITRGLAEITRLGVDAGANPLTFAGLAGLGDMVATCSSRLSRNRFVGEELAKGRPLEEILSSMKNVAEGVYTTPAALKLAEALGVELPITQATYGVLFEGLDLKQAITELMGRPPRSE